MVNFNLIKKILFLILSFVIVSCSLQLDKRRYNKGYYVHFNSKVNKTVPAKNTWKANRVPQNNIISIRNQNSTELKESSVDLTKVNSDPVALKEKASSVNFPLKKNPVSYNKVYSKRDYTKGNLASSSNIADETFIDNPMYALAGSSVLFSFLFMRSRKERILKLTREANKDIKRTRIKIAFMQTAILLLGFFAGKNLFALGYTFTPSPEYVYGGISMMGFGALFANQLKKRNEGFLNFYFKKLCFLVLGTCFTLSSVVIGNKTAAHKEQISPMGHVMKTLDKSVNHVIHEPGVNTSPLTDDERAIISVEIFFCILACLILTALAAVACCATVCSIIFAAENANLFLLALAFGIASSLLILAIIEIIKVITKKYKKLNEA